MKKIVGILVVTLLIATATIPLASSKISPKINALPGTVDQKQELTSQIQWLQGGADNWQVFIPTVALLSEVEVHLGCYYSGSYPVTLTVEKELGMSPITYATLDCSSMPQNQQGWVMFDVIDRCLLPGYTYYIVLRFDPGSEYGWSGSAGNPYPNGESNIGPNWDYAFRTYVLPNGPPSIPIINGPLNGKVGDPNTYTFTSTDPDGDDVSYFIKWGDGNTISWTANQPSGTSFTGTHTWTAPGTYKIEAKAKDEYGCQGDWATYDVMITNKSRAMNIPFLNWLQNHLNMFPILQTLLQRSGLQ